MCVEGDKRGRDGDRMEKTGRKGAAGGEREREREREIKVEERVRARDERERK